jgi:SAM-dependent methyltransferase
MQAHMYELHNELENTHWWFTARREIVLATIRGELEAEPALAAPLLILDIGCGAGGMLRHLAAFGTVVGADPAPAAVAFAAEKGLDVRLGGLPDSLPFAPHERFDIITLLDVIEHLDDDAAGLRTVYRLLQPHGRLVLTVPAFDFLWSGHDIVNEHRRRYRRTSLAARLEECGFEILRMSYFNTVLFPPIAALRLARRVTGSATGATADLGRVPGPLNTMLHHLFAAERHVIRRMALPFGVSLLAVARPDTGSDTP